MRNKMNSEKLISIAISGIVTLLFAVEMNLLLMNLKFFGIVLPGFLSYHILQIIIVTVTVILFNVLLKVLDRSKKNGLFKYFLFAVIMSFLIVLVLLFIVMNIMRIPIFNDYIVSGLETETGQVAMSIAMNFFILLLIIVFVISFVLIIRPKVKYIKYITEKVEEMEMNGFGDTLIVKNHDELSELSMRINSMSVTLKEKQDNEKMEEENKNRLIADISHDLRTPLTSIIGYVDFLKENEFQDKDKCNQYIEVVDRRLNSLKDMINQLFEYTKLSQTDTPLNLERTNLNTLLSYVEFEYGNIYRKQGFQWKMEVPNHEVYLNLDAEKFMRALGNLLENARKYSLPGTEICMQVTEVENYVDIQLSNQTDMEQSDEIGHIFERFYRIDKSRANKNGNSTGLGLPITKRIIELHGGYIMAELKDHRITFLISLPSALSTEEPDGEE